MLPFGPMLRAGVLFHLNLRYSSLEREERRRVVERCYRPMLGLLDRVEGLRLAVEAPAHTLELVDELDPAWTARLAELVAAGRVEFVGSGDTQLIGPLVPERVHLENQRLGVDAYRARFGAVPEVALVNEMAFSQGVVDGYVEAGYDALVVEWNNARRANPSWADALRFVPARTRSPRGRAIDVLWADTVAFQKLQRAVHGELEPEEYAEWLATLDGPGLRHVFVYAGDAEVFDHRPGRFASEPAASEGEWERLAEVLRAAAATGLRWVTPRELLAEARAAGHAAEELVLSTAAAPIPVKKQPKYNVARWAVSGRDDLRANAACHGEAIALASAVAPSQAWRGLCRRWGSDLRSHLTEDRWAGPGRALAARTADLALPELPARPATELEWRRDGRRILVRSEGVEASLFVDRGLALERVAFLAHDAKPWFGTLPMGSFEHIDWTADFYSGHLVVDIPGEPRVTDLSEAPVELQQLPEGLVLTAAVPTRLGVVTKRVFVGADSLRVAWNLPELGARPAGCVRLGTLTLFEDAFGPRLFVTATNGGARERYPIEGEFDQGAQVSPLVSSRGGFGATDGRLVIDDGTRGVELSWDPTRTPAMPLLTHVPVGDRRFCRVVLSLLELDDTWRAGGVLPPFEVVFRGFARGRRP